MTAIGTFKLYKYLYPLAQLKINASIVQHQSRYWATYRTTHLYDLNSSTILTEFDDSFRPLSHKRILIESENLPFEDVRLFDFNGILIALYSFLIINSEKKSDWKYSVGIGIVDISTGLIKNHQSTDSVSTRYNEKNWVPYVFEEELYIITDYEPHLRIVKAEGGAEKFLLKEIYIGEARSGGWQFGEIRGGTPLLQSKSRNPDWFYGFVHSSDFTKDNVKVYVYTIVRFSHQTKVVEYPTWPIGYSEEDLDVEYQRLFQLGVPDQNLKCVFPMGIIEFDDGLLMSYGKDDCVSLIRHYTWTYIESLFDN